MRIYFEREEAKNNVHAFLSIMLSIKYAWRSQQPQHSSNTAKRNEGKSKGGICVD